MKNAQPAILYSTNCPMCKMLEALLKQKKIDFVINSNEDEMIRLGFQSAPMLDVDGAVMNCREAMAWANEQ